MRTREARTAGPPRHDTHYENSANLHRERSRRELEDRKQLHHHGTKPPTSGTVAMIPSTPAYDQQGFSIDQRLYVYRSETERFESRI